MRPKSLAVALVLSFAALGISVSAASATSIGPDAGGYTASTVPFVWEDISDTGTSVGALANADDARATVNMGFSINFYGATFSSAVVSTNGRMTFGTLVADPMDHSNLAMTDNLDVDRRMIAPLWDDWSTQFSADDKVLVDTRGPSGHRRFIVQWHLVRGVGGSPRPVTFQAVIHEASLGAIEFRYLDVDSGDYHAFGASSTVGIRGLNSQAVGGRYLQWSYEQPAIANRTAVQFTRQAPLRAPLGPDSYGYEGSAVPYSFDDITGEEATRIFPNDDDPAAVVPIGFPFEFYGVSRTMAGLTLNGLISFDGTHQNFVNQDLAGPQTIDLPVIAPLWDDWITTGNAGDFVAYRTMGTAPYRRFVVQWHLVRHYQEGTTLSETAIFEAVLFETTNAIEFRWRDVDVEASYTLGRSASIGIRDAGAPANGRALSWSFDQQLAGNFRSVRFNAPPIVAQNTAPTPDPGGPYTVAEGSTVTLGGSATDAEGDPVSYSWDLDGDSTFETAGATPTFSAATLDGPLTRSVTLNACDDNGACATASTTVSVTNVAPEGFLNAPASAVEGDHVVLSVSNAFDVAPADVISYAFDCGSGFSAPSAVASYTCSAHDNGTLTVVARVADDDGDHADYTAQVQVANTAPTAALSAPQSVPEGTPIPVALTNAHDVQFDLPWLTFAFDCGDGAGFAAATPWPATSCPTDDDDQRTVQGRVFDDDGGSNTYDAFVFVTNVAPTATFQAPLSVTEGMPFGLSLDDPVDPSGADTTAGFTRTFDCGDGTFTSSPQCFAFDDGTLTVRGRIRDKDGGTTTYDATLDVVNDAPTATLLAPLKVDEGDPIALQVVDIDDVPADLAGLEFAYDCGDGDGYGAFGSANAASCPTDDDGTRTVRAIVRDPDGAQTEMTVTTEVRNVAPTATLTAPETVDEGDPIALGLTDHGDASSVDRAAGFTLEYACGSDDFGPTASCPTADDGTLTVRGRITDKDGGARTYTRQVTVKSVAPTADFVHAPIVPEGMTFALELRAVSDPSADDTAAGFTYAFDCGDGDGLTAYGPEDAASCATDDDGLRDVRARVRDADGDTREYTGTVEVRNVAPSATFTVTSPVDEGDTITVALTGATDPSAADRAAGITIEYSCASGPFTPAASCPTTDDGSYNVRGRVTDKDGGTRIYSRTVTVHGIAPSATLTHPASVPEGTPFTVALEDASDPSAADTGAGFAHRFDCGSGYGPFTSAAERSCPTDDEGTRAVRGLIRDDDLLSREYSGTVEVTNVAPTATFTAPPEVPEGDAFTLALSDPADPSTADTAAGFEYAFDCGSGSFGAYSASTERSCPADDDGARDVRARIRDVDGGTRTYTRTVGVTNVAPSITGVTGPVDPLRLGTPATVAVAFTDPGSADTHTVRFGWDDGTTTTGAATSATRTYTAPGVYRVDVTVTDDDGGSAQGRFEYVVVFDPSGGFVTGGGWVTAPAGSHIASPSLSGKATFGFTSQYKKGATTPTGETQFQFHAAGLQFHSTDYQWLVVSGPKAQYKGTGVLNGAPGHRFLLTATDGQVSGGGGADRFRIKITDPAGAVVFDNVPGASDDLDAAAPQVLGGGSVVIKR